MNHSDASPRHINLTFGRLLRELRRERNLTQEELSERSGLSTLFISFMENGRRQPTITTLLRLSEALGLSLTALAARLEEALKAPAS